MRLALPLAYNQRGPPLLSLLSEELEELEELEEELDDVEESDRASASSIGHLAASVQRCSWFLSCFTCW